MGRTSVQPGQEPLGAQVLEGEGLGAGPALLQGLRGLSRCAQFSCHAQGRGLSSGLLHPPPPPRLGLSGHPIWGKAPCSMST